MAVTTTLAACSQSPGSNGPDGTSDAPSTLDDAIRYALSFIASLRDGKASVAEVDVASTGICDIGGANSPIVRITGTTTITNLGTNYTGPRFIRFAAALTLTHNASTLILPGGANIVTAAGDTCVAIPLAAGWYVSHYQRANQVVPASIPAFSYTQSVSQNLTSGVATKITFTTSEFDTSSGMYASSRFTPTVAGYYQISAAVYLSASTLTSYNLYLYKNGAVSKRGATAAALGGAAWESSMSALVYMNGTTDYVEVYADGVGTGTISTNNTASVTYFQGVLARPA